MSALLLLICIEEREEVLVRRRRSSTVLMMKSKITEITAKMAQMVIITRPSAELYRELDLSVLTSTPPPPPSRLIFNLPTKTCWAVALASSLARLAGAGLLLS